MVISLIFPQEKVSDTLCFDSSEPSSDKYSTILSMILDVRCVLDCILNCFAMLCFSSLAFTVDNNLTRHVFTIYRYTFYNE